MNLCPMCLQSLWWPAGKIPVQAEADEIRIIHFGCKGSIQADLMQEKAKNIIKKPHGSI